MSTGASAGMKSKITVSAPAPFIDRFTSAYFAASKRYYGDYDNDGQVTTDDARTALRMAVGITPAPTGNDLTCLDTDFDGEVDTDDARYILRMAVGLEPKEYMSDSDFKPDSSVLIAKNALAREHAELDALQVNAELSKAALKLAEQLYANEDPRFLSNGEYWFTVVKSMVPKAAYIDACFYCGSGISGAAYTALCADASANEMLLSEQFNSIGAGCYEAPDGLYYWCVITAKI